MTSKTLRFIFDHPLKQGPTVKKKKKKEKNENAKTEYLENEKFHS